MSETNRSRSPQGSRRDTATGRSASKNSRSSAGKNSRGRQSSSDRILAVQNARNLDSRGRGTARRNTGGKKRRRGRRQGPDFAKILLILIGIAIFILCVAVGVRSCGKTENSDGPVQEESSGEPETKLEAEITINGIPVHGMTKSEAREAILKDMGWAMKVSFNGETRDVENVMEANIEKVLTEAFDMPHETPKTVNTENGSDGDGESGENGRESIAYTISTDGLEEAIRSKVDTIAEGWDVKPKNGSISSFDKASNDFVFSGAQNGKVIDRDKLTADLAARVAAGEYDATVAAAANEVEPEITEAEARASFKRLGTFTTTTTSNKDRNENIRIASQALNGKIIQPGETFSFNETTGNRTTDKGYKPAGAYQNGVLVEEPGGGVCQVSSTLYNAVVFAGLKTTERHAHSYEPSYVTPGEDAMVSYDGYSGPDMKFVNNSKTAVGIKTSFSDQKLTISIYGNPILEEGVTLSMHSEKVKDIDPPAPKYEEDPTLEPGVEKEVVKAKMGSRWTTYLVTKKNGEVVSDLQLHNSTYNGKPATIRRNTSGTVAASTEDGSVTDSSAADETTTGVDSSTAASSSEPDSSTSVPNSPAGNLPTADGPGSESQSSGNDSPQNMGPGDVILPSEGGTGGPGEQSSGNYPGAGQSPAGPADMSPSQAETQSPASMGIIPPMAN